MHDADIDTLARTVEYVLTDSRTYISEDNIPRAVFVALRTPLGDGQRFISHMYDRGIRFFIVSNDYSVPKDMAATFVKVADTMEAMLQLCSAHMTPGLEQIVITGSTGKTSLKEKLRQTIPGARASIRSWNSLIGTALSVWYNTRDGQARTIITEVGIDGPGQARRLQPLLKPTVAYITRTDTTHDEAFDSHSDKLREKFEVVIHAHTIYYDPGDPDIERIADEYRAQYPHKTIKPLKVEAPFADSRYHLSNVSGGTLLIRDYLPSGNDPAARDAAYDFAWRRRSGRDLVVLDSDAIPDYQEFVNMHPRQEFDNKVVLMQGEPGSIMDRIALYLEDARHDSVLEVDLDAIVHNYNYYRSLAGETTTLIAMVKADAYGCGAVEVARTLDNRGVAAFAVAVVDEGVNLRRAGITSPIIVLNPITNNFESLFRYNLEPAVFSRPELLRLIDEGRRAGVSRYPVHIKLDTGMHRLGFVAGEIARLNEDLQSQSTLKVASVFSHLATADCPDLGDYTLQQVRTFDSMTAMLDPGYRPRRHLCNTAGISTLGDLRGHYDHARLGLGLYGLSPLGREAREPLKPAATLTGTIISLRTWPAGTPIGYGCKGVTRMTSTIATVPLGYADGLDRRLGNGNARFIVNGKPCPTVGNICMDLFMLDVTGTRAAVGDTVQIFGPDAPVQVLADTLGTIPYEILTSVSPRVKRVYTQK